MFSFGLKTPFVSPSYSTMPKFNLYGAQDVVFNVHLTRPQRPSWDKDTEEEALSLDTLTVNNLIL
jgi:hypothetical protein